MTATPPVTADTINLPRILCLHGGGTSGSIFRMQSRALISHLSPHFRLVFADGPFFCDPGPGMIPVYANEGPFRRWLRWLADAHPPVDDAAAIEEVEYAMRTAMERDTGTGEFIGLLGFSQGAKLAASVLYESQLRTEHGVGDVDGMYARPGDVVEGIAGGRWRFAVCLAGRAPLVCLSGLSEASETMVHAGAVSEGFDLDRAVNRNILKWPTLHVHGMKDQGLHLHRRLLNDYCSKESVTLLEWDGDHRVPLKKDDVRPLAKAIVNVAKKAGVELKDVDGN